MKSIIVYYSLEGNIRLVAKMISNLLGSDMMELAPVKPYPTGRISKYLGGKDALKRAEPELLPYDKDINDYDAVIIGTPVWASSPAPPLNTFMKTAKLDDKRVGFFVSSLGGDGSKCLEKMEEMLGRKPWATLDLREPKKAYVGDVVEQAALFANSMVGEFETDEVWDLFDEDEVLLDEKMKRGKKIPEGHYHKIVSVWIKNSEGKYLMSLRSTEKNISPNTWECTGGAVDVGETTLDAAVREVREELGIELDPEKGVLARSTKHDDMHEFYDVWVFETEADPETLVLQREEVADVKWMSKEEIAELYEKNELNALLYYYDEIM